MYQVWSSFDGDNWKSLNTNMFAVATKPVLGPISCAASSENLFIVGAGIASQSMLQSVDGRIWNAFAQPSSVSASYNALLLPMFNGVLAGYGNDENNDINAEMLSSGPQWSNWTATGTTELPDHITRRNESYTYSVVLNNSAFFVFQWPSVSVMKLACVPPCTAGVSFMHLSLCCAWLCSSGWLVFIRFVQRHLRRAGL